MEIIKKFLELKNICKESCDRFMQNEKNIKYRKFIKNNSISITVSIIVLLSISAIILLQVQNGLDDLNAQVDRTHVVNQDNIDQVSSVRSQLTQLKSKEAQMNAVLGEMRKMEF